MATYTEAQLRTINQRANAVLGKDYLQDNDTLWRGNKIGTLDFITDNFASKAQHAVGSILVDSDNSTLVYDSETPSITPDLTDTGVTAGTYGNGTNVSQIVVDEFGRITSAVNVPISAVPPGSISLTQNHVLVGNASNVATDVAMSGDASIVASGALTLATVNSNVGTYGSSTKTVTITADAKGRITAISEQSITGFISSALTNAHILVGNGSNIATDVAVSGDLTLANTGAFTLNTVNSNVGTFGSSTKTVTVAVDAKGRITAISEQSITGFEVPLTFSDGLTRTVNNVTNNLITGVSGGQVIIGGTAVGDGLKYKGTTGNGTAAVIAHEFLVGNNGGSSVLAIYNNKTFTVDSLLTTIDASSSITHSIGSIVKLNITSSATTFASNPVVISTTLNGNTFTTGTGTLTLSTFTLTVAGTASISGTNTGDQTITLTGDVTGTGTGSFATTIASGVVTYAKIQNTTTNKLLGRATAGSGVMEEITLGTGLSYSGTTLNVSGFGTGTVTSVSVVNNQGISGVVATSTTTPAITISIGALTGVTSFNGLVITANTGVITTGTFRATPVEGPYGGTGQSSYTVGDILSANSTTSLSKIAAPAAGYIFTGVAAGSQPVWTNTNGTYTPTLYNTTNIDSSTARVTSYYRIGDMVYVFGSVSIDPTTTNVNTTLGMDLPIPSNFADIQDCGGTCSAFGLIAASNLFGIGADVTNKRAQFNGRPATIVLAGFSFHFGYRIL